jgi:hypothetical protein
MEEQIKAKGLSHAVVCIRGDSNIKRSRPSESLARNDVNASGSILEARCDITTPAALAAAFPDRSVWIYDANDRLSLASPPRATAALASAPPAPEEATENGIVARIAGWIIDVISKAGYAGVTLLMAIESACIPLPSEIIMPFAGYLVSIGRLNLLGVSIAGAIGCNLGSIVAYAAGRYGGRPRRLLRPPAPGHPDLHCLSCRRGAHEHAAVPRLYFPGLMALVPSAGLDRHEARQRLEFRSPVETCAARARCGDYSCSPGCRGLLCLAPSQRTEAVIAQAA